MVSPKIWFLASWILVIALQSKWLPLLGAVYILAVFLYHYQRGVVAVAIATIIWYWIAATVALFVWQEFDIWLAGWVHIFIAWFAPIILTAILPFTNPEADVEQPNI